MYTGGLDLCDFTDNNGAYSSSGSFNGLTGEWIFSTNDIDTFEPGSYEMIITFDLGTVSQPFTFTFQLISPCASNSIVFTNNHPFANNAVFEYVLGD